MDEEAEEIDERVLRALADVDNQRKRLERDLEARVESATRGVLCHLLPAFDDLQRCLAHGSDEPSTLRDGVELTLQQFMDVLAQAGAVAIEVEPGMLFDPAEHEAVARQPTGEHPPNTILEVVQVGFRFHDRLLRPTRVVVSAEPD